MPTLTTGENLALQALKAPIQVIDAEIATDRLLPGQGFNVATGAQAMGNSVVYRDASDLQKLDPGSGQHSEFICESVEDFEELKSRLDVSASASFGSGIYSGSAAASYMKDEKHTRFDSYLLVGVRVLNPALILKKSVLSPAALRAVQEGISSFLEKCGNSYVYGYVTGGEILGIVRYTATSDEQASQVRVQVDAAAKGFASGQFNMSQAVSSVKTHKEMKYKLLRDGGAGDLPTPDKLMDAANALPTALRDPANVRVVRVFVRGYQTVENLPHKALNLHLLEQQVQALETTANYLSAARQVANDIEVIGSDLGNYEIPGDSAQVVANAARTIAEIIADLERIAALIAAEPTTPAPNRPVFPYIPAHLRPPPPPAVHVPALELWTDRDMQGAYLATDVSVPNFQGTPVGDINDQVTCIRLNGAAGQYTATFFLDGDYRGQSFAFQSPHYVASLADTAPGWWNDNISSVSLAKNL